MSAVASAVPRQLVLKCKLKDCDATLELMTHGSRDTYGVHKWTQLSASAFVTVKKRGLMPREVRVAFAMDDLSACHLSRWYSADTLWVDASFDLDRTDTPKVIEFLTGLGVAIEDHRKPAKEAP